MGTSFLTQATQTQEGTVPGYPSPQRFPKIQHKPCATLSGCPDAMPSSMFGLTPVSQEDWTSGSPLKWTLGTTPPTED